MRNSTSCFVVALVAVVSLVTTGVGRDAEQRSPTPVDNQMDAGVILNEGGSASSGGDIVYGGNIVPSGYYFRPFPGYRDYDDIHLEPGPRGELVEYRVRTFGSGVTGTDAGQPYDVNLSLWTDTMGNPAFGVPDTMIPGTLCVYDEVPLGSTTLVCTVPPGISIPDGLWIRVESDQDNCGWLVASGMTLPTPRKTWLYLVSRIFFNSGTLS